MTTRRAYTNETGLVHAIVASVLKKYPDAFGFKVHGGPFQAVGIPDLLFCINGMMVGIEAKFQHAGESETHARERATPIQRKRISEINHAGGIAGVALTPEEALDIIRRGFHKQDLSRAASKAREAKNETKESLTS